MTFISHLCILNGKKAGKVKHLGLNNKVCWMGGLEAWRSTLNSDFGNNTKKVGGWMDEWRILKPF